MNSEDLKKIREALSDYYELARKLRDDETREAGYAEDEHEGMLRAEEAIHLFDAHITALSQQEAEPVAYQCRMRASWNSDQLWTKWEECSKGTFEDYKRAPTNSDWYFESRALYEHPPKPAALPQPEREQFSWEHEREQPVASVPQDSEDSFERWVNTHPGYTYRDVWQAGREYQSWLSVASVPQDVEEFIKAKSFETSHKSGRLIKEDDLRTFLSQRDAGCVGVPVEPTEEMVLAAINTVAVRKIPFINDTQKVTAIYRAMLTASKEGV